MDATVVAKFGNPVTQADVEESIVENTPFVDEAVYTTKPRDPEHVIIEQDDAPPPENSNEYLTTKVILPRNEGYQKAVIKQRKWDLEGNLIGQRNTNLMLEKRV